MRDSDDITRAVREHANTVARVCSLYFGSRPERDDAFQETFLKYAQEGRAFGDDEHRKAWLIRVALYLKYYEGYKASEIAQMLGIPENTVYTNLARGREELKEVLAHGR